MSKTGTAEHQAIKLAATLHKPPAHPHWSESVDWPADRWDPMSNAPSCGYPILHIRGRTADGHVLESMHFAQDLSGDEQPAFSGWFVQTAPHHNSQVTPVEWQPLRAQPSTPA